MTAPQARRAIGIGLAFFLSWLVGYPLLLTLVEAAGGPGRWTGEYFGEFFSRGDEWQALWRSTWISVASVTLAAAVGVPLAFLFEWTEFPGRRSLGALIALPVALPPLVGVIAFDFLYGGSGLVSGVLQGLGISGLSWQLAGPSAILLVHAYSMYVYFYLFTRAGLSRLDRALLEAAASLGAGRTRTFLRVIAPLLRPALAGAALLTFMTSLASFSAPYIFGERGKSFRVMTTQIVLSKLDGEVEVAKVETVMLASLAFLGLWGLRRLDRGGDLVAGARGVAPVRRQLKSRSARVATGAMGWLLALLLLLPHLTLLLMSFVPPNTWTIEALPPVLDLGNYRALFSDLERLRPALNSLWMAMVATLAALGLGLATARVSLRVRGALGGLLESLLAIPWAIPGTVFAIALATSFSVSAPHLGRFILIGTPWLLPLAYLVRSLPLTGRASLAGLRQLDPALEEAAASLSASPARIMRRVVLPLVRPALAAGAGLAFITAMGDFVTSNVLWVKENEPISMAIYGMHRLAENGVAAVYGVLLMVMSAVAFLLWGRGEGV